MKDLLCPLVGINATKLWEARGSLVQQLEPSRYEYESDRNI